MDDLAMIDADWEATIHSGAGAIGVTTGDFQSLNFASTLAKVGENASSLDYSGLKDTGAAQLTTIDNRLGADLETSWSNTELEKAIGMDLASSLLEAGDLS
mgnify:FL=1